MSNFRHGLSIGIETAGADIFLSLKAFGKLTPRIIKPLRRCLMPHWRA
jgi:hypothetical protein